MIKEDHFNQCSTLLHRLIEDYTPLYKQTVESNRIIIRTETTEYEEYKDGFDERSYRAGYVNQIMSSESFISFHHTLTSGHYRSTFYVFGKRFSVDVE